MDKNFKSMTESDFRRRFKTAFELDPKLTSEEFFVILSASNFNSQKAYQKVTDRARKPTRFLVPNDLARGSPIAFNSVSPTSDTAQLPSPKTLAENSDDEILSLIETTKPCPKSSRPVPRKRYPEEESENELLEDSSQPRKRRIHSKYSTVKSKTSTNAIVSTTSFKYKSSIAFRQKNSVVEKKFNVAKQHLSPLEHSADEDYDSDFPSVPQLLWGNYGKFNAVKKKQRPNGVPDDAPFIDLSDLEDVREKSEADSELDSDRTPISWDSSNEVETAELQMRDTPERTKQMDDEVLKHRLTTLATEHIRLVAGALFNRAIGAVEGDIEDIEEKMALIDLTCDPRELRRAAWEGSHRTEKVEFVQPSTWRDAKTGRVGYSAVVIDGVAYRRGDCVIIRSPKSGPTSKVSAKRDDVEAIPAYDEVEPWFARIVFLFETEDGSERVHLRRFVHGADTIFGSETAGPRELFLTTACEDDTLYCIAAKIKVDFVSGNVDGEKGNGVVEHSFKEKNHYFYRLHWRADQEKFTDAAEHENPFHRSESPHCDCCEEKERAHEFKLTRIINESSGHVQAFSQRGVNYRLHDFVYITSSESTDPYRIGQITEIGYLNSSERYSAKVELAIQVHQLKRHDAWHKKWFDEIEDGQKHAVRDERRLYFTNKSSHVSSKKIQGKCQVRHPSDIDDIDSYKDGPDTFWVKDKVLKPIEPSAEMKLQPLHHHELRLSKETGSEISTRSGLKERFLSEFQPLNALELFFGCGGMSLGLEQSQAIKAKWAVEFAPAPVKTGRQNFPDVIFYNGDGSVCLERAMKEAAGIELEPMKDNSGKILPRMPSKGEVEVIVGGFPCPGYSKANHSPKADDIKNTLITMTLSYVEFYRPKYVLLENVKDLLHHRLGGRQAGPNKVVGGLERGTVKFILRTLTSMGYQVEFTPLQAGEYGVPQSRQRAFFWASLPGNPLPNYPQPQNKFSGMCAVSWHRKHDSSRGAPHPEVTVGDTLTDLPAFDWVNPHQIVGRSCEENLDRIRRAAKIRQVQVLNKPNFVGDDKQAYAYHPLSEYQRRLRKGVPDHKLRNHVTIKYFDQPRWNKNGGIMNVKTEQVCSIPMRSGANHRELPQPLRPWFLSHPDSRASRHDYYPGRYRRLDMEEHFETCLTEIDPNGKNGKTLHPTQHRIVTVREYARAMGFPDSFTFDVENMRMVLVIRMIGNAVPVPLAKALGDELLETLFEQWMKGQKKNPRKRGEKGVVSAGREAQYRKAKTVAVPPKGRGTASNPISLDDDDDGEDFEDIENFKL